MEGKVDLGGIYIQNIKGDEMPINITPGMLTFLKVRLLSTTNTLLTKQVVAVDGGGFHLFLRQLAGTKFRPKQDVGA